MIELTNETTREQRLQWAKQRALAYLDAGESVIKSYTSIASDLKSHPETAKHPGIELGHKLLLMGDLNTPEEMRKFIEGFN